MTADLTKANLLGANLLGAHLGGTDLTGTEIDDACMGVEPGRGATPASASEIPARSLAIVTKTTGTLLAA